MIAALYPSKKAMREAIGKPLRYSETSMFAPEYTPNGRITFVGPSATKRVFYGTVTLKDGLIAKVQ